MSGEIMQVALHLPPGLVDHIIAGHVHQGIAHVVNGIAVTSSYSSTRAFSRVDFTLDRGTGKVKQRRVFPPQPACLYVLIADGGCAVSGSDPSLTARASYEGFEVQPDEAVAAVAERAAAGARAFRDRKLGVSLTTAFRKPATSESPLANLMTDALLASLPVDVAIHNVRGGIRNGLPAGELTYGDVYKMFPFDNRSIVLDLSGKELRDVITAQSLNPGRRAGFSGMRIAVDCDRGRTDVSMTLASGRTLEDTDRVSVLVNDYLALGGDDILAPIMPDGGFATDSGLPLTRDLLVDWFSAQPGPLRPEDFQTIDNPKWRVPDSCVQ
jgi:5'-nucleotidase